MKQSLRDPLGDREVARLMLEVGVGLLQVDRDGVVQPGLDSPGLQLAADAVAVGMQHDEQVPDVPPPRRLDGQLERQPGEPLVVPIGQPPPGLGPALEVLELDAQDGPLEAVHAIVEAELGVVVAAALGVVAQAPQPLGDRLVVGRRPRRPRRRPRGSCRGRS